MDHVKNHELIPLSHELSVWAQRIRCQLQTGTFDRNPMLTGQYYIVGYKLRKALKQIKEIEKVLSSLELEAEPGTEVAEPDDSVIGEGFIRLVKAIYGDDFEFETFMLTNKEGKIVAAFDRKDGDDERG